MSVRLKFWKSYFATDWDVGNSSHANQTVFIKNPAVVCSGLFPGETLLRVNVSANFSLGCYPAGPGVPPITDALAAAGIQLAVYVDTTSEFQTMPPPLYADGEAQDAENIVWRAVLDPGPVTLTPDEQGDRYEQIYHAPQGPLAESHGKRGPSQLGGGAVWLQWDFESGDFVPWFENGFTNGSQSALGGTVGVRMLIEGQA